MLQNPSRLIRTSWGRLRQRWGGVRWTRRKVVLLALSLLTLAGAISGIVYWKKRPKNKSIPEMILLDPLTPSSHWAFQPVRVPEVPAVQNNQWPRNPLDHFI